MSTLAGVLSQKFHYVIPRFQRGYAWTHQVERLIEDLHAAFEEKRPFYFLGAIVLVRVDEDHVEVIDGQQRLISFTILIASLRDLINDPRGKEALQALINDASEIGRLQLRSREREFFRVAVQRPGQIAALAEGANMLTEARANFAEAAAIMVEALGEKSQSELAAFAHFVCSTAVFNVVETSDRSSAPSIYRRLNDPDTEATLTASDLMKAELFEMAGFTDAEADEASDRWDGVLEALGQRRLDELLSLMPEVESGTSIPAANEIGVFRRNFLNSVDAAAFLQKDLGRYADAFQQLRGAKIDAGATTIEVNRRLKCLALLRDRDWLGPALSIAADGPDDPEFLRRFFAGLERLAFTNFLGIIPANKRRERISRVLAARFEADALFGPDGALELTSAEKRRVIIRLNEPFIRDQNRRRIILMRVNAALPGGETLALTDDATVEHVLPINPSGQWFELFPDDVARDLLTHIIGNMTIVSNAQNQIAGDKLYPEKLRAYQREELGPMRALTRTLPQDQAAVWNPGALRRRHERLMTAIAADWSLT
jgi:hypothetical protein